MKKINHSLLLRKLTMFGLFFLLPFSGLIAQEVKPASPNSMSSQEFTLMVLLVAVIVIALLVLVVTIQMLSVMYALLVSKENPNAQKKESFWAYYWKKLDRQWTNAVPLEKENTVMLDHNYDDIRELNNHLPPWWVWLFYITIGFSAVYMLNYHVFGWQPLPNQEYEIELADANKQIEAYKKLYAANLDENNVEITKESAELAAGKELYLKECKACHGEKGEGGIGPNLTDEYWLHGGDVKAIFKTIKVGVPTKGMISWEKKIKPDMIRNVSSYILTLQGTNPPNAKAPQGEKYVAKK